MVRSLGEFFLLRMSNIVCTFAAEFNKLLTLKIHIMKTKGMNEEKNPWWVIALKILAYAIGLILGGYGTTAAAATLNLL